MQRLGKGQMAQAPVFSSFIHQICAGVEDTEVSKADLMLPQGASSLTRKVDNGNNYINVFKVVEWGT